MKKKFDKIIKLFFALAMIFSQMYSPLSVFAETIDEVNSGETTSDSDVTLEEDTDTTDEVTDETSEESLDEEDTTEVIDEEEDTTLDDTENTGNENDDDTASDITDENNDNTGSDNETTGEDNNENTEENNDSEVANLDITVEGNVELVSSEDKNYNYNVVTPNDNLNVKFTPVITNTDSNVVDLVINDTYTITDDFSFDFGKLAGGTYKFTFNLYEESSVVDTVTVNVSYNTETPDQYYDVSENTTLEDLAYMFVSATLDDSVDTNKLLADYLTLNNELGMTFDSNDNTIVIPYGSTDGNVTTIGDLVNDISRVLETTYESDEDDYESIYTGLEVNVTFMGNDFNYTVIALGDTDTGYVTDSDVQDILDFALENKELDPYGAKASDVNQDGEVNILDVTNVIKAINTDSFDTSRNEDKYSINLNGDTNVKVGDTLTISLDISGFTSGTVNGIEGILNYDSSVLKLSGVNSDVFSLGTLNPDNNKFMFADYNALDSDNTIVTFTFKVIGSGNTTVSVNNVKLALDGTLLDLETDNANINISAEEEQNNNNNNTTTQESTPVPAKPMSNNYVVQYVSYSNDSLITDLIIKGYNIKFNPNVFEYTINVGSNVNSLDLTAILSDPNATYEVFGNENFKEGENTVEVVVTAEDGSTSTYKIKVNKEKAKEKAKDKKENGFVKTIVIVLIILVIIGLIYLIFKDDDEDDEEYSPKNKGSSKKKK